MSIFPSLPSSEGPSSASLPKADAIKQNTLDILPKEKLVEMFPKTIPKVCDDDLEMHQELIDAIDANFDQISNAIKSAISPVLEKCNVMPKPFEEVVQKIDQARSQAARGEFGLAEKTLKEAWNHFDAVFSGGGDDKLLKEFLNEAKEVIRESIDIARKCCKDCELYISTLSKAASVKLKTVEKDLVNAAFKELHEARANLQKIWEGKEKGNIESAKAKVRSATAKCRDLSWVPANAAIAKKQVVAKLELATSLIPKATAEKIVKLATQQFGTTQMPGRVLLGGKQYEVAHDLSKGGYQIVRLPTQEQVLGKGAWNVVIRVNNISNKCFQALRQSIGKSPNEEQVLRSIQIYKDIRNLQGTTVGPEALIRKGTGGVLSSLYSDDMIKWLQMFPPSELRWEGFKSALNSFIEFAKDGNVHGDIHPGNLSIVYKKGGAIPATVKIEDLDGACHIIERHKKDQTPIYNSKAAEVGIVCKFATQKEVDEWDKCIKEKNLPGIAEVRFGQDILAMGITLYQILTLDFDIDNLYLNKECSPFTDMNGNVVPGKFEDGIFRNGKPNIESLRFALEEYPFLTSDQKEKIVKFITAAITQNTKERATLKDLEIARTI